MQEDWNIQKFSQLWDNEDRSKAVEYKNSFIPSSLYKYSPLFNKSDPYYTEGNNRRLKTLQEKKIWLSNYRYLNDPFEFRTLYLDRERIEEHGWDISVIEKILDQAKNSAQIGCFSDYGVNHMPLWAHYSNNHKGFCVQYKILDKSAIYPVIYLSKREATATIPTWISSEFIKSANTGETSRDLQKYLLYLFISFSCKFEHWEYEREFRLFNVEGKIDQGRVIPLTEVGIDVDKIYAGISCEHKTELIDLGRELGCEVYEMTFDEYSENFSLGTNRIA